MQVLLDLGALRVEIRCAALPDDFTFFDDEIAVGYTGKFI
jgi:hypothetical protein